MPFTFATLSTVEYEQLRYDVLRFLEESGAERGSEDRGQSTVSGAMNCTLTPVSYGHYGYVQPRR